MIPGARGVCCGIGSAAEAFSVGCSFVGVIWAIAAIGAILWFYEHVDAVISFTLWAVVVIISILSVSTTIWELKKRGGKLGRGVHILLIGILIFGLSLPILFGFFRHIKTTEIVSQKSNFQTEIPRYFIPDSMWR